MDFNDTYKRIRNKIRKFSKHEFLDACVADVQSVPSDALTDLRRAPWLTLLIAKWALQDQMVPRRGDTVTQEHIHALKENLWRSTGALSDNPSVRLALRQMLYVQIEIQRPQDKGVAREAAVINALNPKHRIREVILSEVGVDPLEYVLIVLTSITLAKAFSLHQRPGNFAQLRSRIPQERLVRCLNSLFPNWGVIENYVRSSSNGNRKRPAELSEYPRLARWPGVYIPGERIELWHPAFVHRAFEGFLHKTISSKGEEFVQSYGEAFEKYVSRMLSETPAQVVGESDLIKRFGRDERIVDFVLSYDNTNVYVECKSGIFYDQIMDVTNAAVLFDKSRRIRRAITQGASTSQLINQREEGFPLRKKTEFHLIVLSHEVHFGTASRMAEIFPPGSNLGFSDYPNCRFSATEVYVISIGDFERMVLAEQQGLIDIPNFLSGCLADDSTPATAKMMMEQHLSKNQIPILVSREVEDLFDAANAIFEEILPD